MVSRGKHWPAGASNDQQGPAIASMASSGQHGQQWSAWASNGQQGPAEAGSPTHVVDEGLEDLGEDAMGLDASLRVGVEGGRIPPHSHRGAHLAPPDNSLNPPQTQSNLHKFLTNQQNL